MPVVTTLDISGLTAAEYRAILDHMGVETRPAAGIYLHLTTPTDFGYLVIEVWDRREGFDEFVATRLTPAAQALGIQRPTAITVNPLHNVFAPRLAEIPALASVVPGGPAAKAR